MNIWSRLQVCFMKGIFNCDSAVTWRENNCPYRNDGNENHRSFLDDIILELPLPLFALMNEHINANLPSQCFWERHTPGMKQN